jgi:hypothetical protein
VLTFGIDVRRYTFLARKSVGFSLKGEDGKEDKEAQKREREQSWTQYCIHRLQSLAEIWLCLGIIVGFFLGTELAAAKEHEATLGDFLVRISEATAACFSLKRRELSHATDLTCTTARPQVYLLKDIFVLEVVTTQLSCWLGFYRCIHGDGIDI